MDRVELDSDPLHKVSGSSLVVGRGNLTKGGQPVFLVELVINKADRYFAAMTWLPKNKNLKVSKQSKLCFFLRKQSKLCNLEFISTTDLYLPSNKNFHWKRNKYNKRADSSH